MSKINQFFMASLLTIMSTAAAAKETINVVWGFNPGSNQALTVRSIIDQANQLQNKYNFVFAHRPGAGGTIAAKQVIEDPENTLVSMSSSFIIRPLYNRGKDTHNLDDYMPLLVQGVGAPLIFVSNRFDSLPAALAASKLTIGVSGIGGISHLAANELLAKHQNVTVVNFKNMVEASTAAAGGHVDLAVTFFSDAKAMINEKSLNVLALTGPRNVSDIPAVNSKQLGIDTSKLTANYAIFASKKMTATKQTELRQILEQANQSQTVLESYARDYLNVPNFTLAQSNTWYDQERTYWQKVVDKLHQKESKQ